ncbi:MAG: hypothetical protein ACRD1F_11450, partial [Terriglobales bacterium]
MTSERSYSWGKRAGVIGAGSWGTALALVLRRQGYAVGLWVYEAELADRIRSEHENAVYLPGFALDEGITATTELAQAVAPLTIIAVPSH